MKTTDLKNEIKIARQLREELAVQAHLFKLDAKDEWKDLERRFHQLQQKMKSEAKTETDQLSADLEQIAKKLIGAYRGLRVRFEAAIRDRG